MTIDFNDFSNYARTAALGRRDAIQLTTDKDVTFQTSNFKVSDSDKSWSLTRSTSDKNANNSIRTSFLNSVMAETGLKLSELPKSVKDALSINDYSLVNGQATSGKPLTAFRIRQVATALENHKQEIEQIRATKQQGANAAKQAAPVHDPSKVPQTTTEVYSAKLDSLVKRFNSLNSNILKNGNSKSQSAIIRLNPYYFNLLVVCRRLAHQHIPDNLSDVKDKFNQDLAQLKTHTERGIALTIQFDRTQLPSTSYCRLDDTYKATFNQMITDMAEAFNQQMQALEALKK